MILYRQMLRKDYVVKLYLKDGHYYVEGHNQHRPFKTVPMHGFKHANNVYEDWLSRCQGTFVYGRTDCPVEGTLKRI